MGSDTLCTEIKGTAHARKGCVALGWLRPGTRLPMGATAAVRLLHARSCPRGQSWHHREPGLAFGTLPSFLLETKALLSLNASFSPTAQQGEGRACAQLSRANMFFADVANSRVTNSLDMCGISILISWSLLAFLWP